MAMVSVEGLSLPEATQRSFKPSCVASICGRAKGTGIGVFARSKDSSLPGILPLSWLTCVFTIILAMGLFASQAYAVDDSAEEYSGPSNSTYYSMRSTYKDLWSEAAKSTTGDDKTASSSTNEKSSGASKEEEADKGGQDGESGDVERFDPLLNDLGDDNFVNLQQVPDSSFLYDTSLYDLVHADTSFQKNQVQVKGEVVGDAIRSEQDPGKYWILLVSTDDEKEASISVLVDEATISRIDTFGAYNHRGTILRVRGIFYLACPSHEGSMDIHADSVTVVSKGSITTDELDWSKFIPGAVFCGIGILLAGLYRFFSERQR